MPLLLHVELALGLVGGHVTVCHSDHPRSPPIHLQSHRYTIHRLQSLHSPIADRYHLSLLLLLLSVLPRGCSF